MITEAMEEIFRRWEEHSQRPFWRMVRLFVARIFRGGGDADTDGLDLGIGLVLTLLALPGGFRFPFPARQIWNLPAMAARDSQRGSAAGCASRRIFLHCPFHDRYRRGCRVAMGRHLSRPPRLYEPGPAADPDPDHLPGQSGGSLVLGCIGLIRRQCGILHPVPHGGGSNPKQIPILREIRGGARGRSNPSKYFRVLCCVLHIGSFDGVAAAASLQAIFVLHSRHRRGVPGRASLHHFRGSGLLAAGEGACTIMDIPDAFMLVSGSCASLCAAARVQCSRSCLV